MSLELLQQQAEYESKQKPEKLPNWVSSSNKSIDAWYCLKSLESLCQEYINTHRKPSDFSKTSLWQIRVSHVAKAINVKPATLDMAKGSKWASGFRSALDASNKRLLEDKEKRVGSYLRAKGKGNASKTHDELVKKCQKIQKELEDEKQRNAEELWSNRLSELSLPVRQLLGLN
ncbi:hypothetical protein GT360_01465 [Vibrio astriarenae]|uniref:Uncharacterized protein n=1 Tax=Vibrio astriarenae TaxID=1481923 RepID=A0A7Z2T0V3_9VIBR|nr:hypothetical protein [Vibrio astriarenae]QIA62278.1 hypothetical protein GT360_01465 [Vibrio astriarenae]